MLWLTVGYLGIGLALAAMMLAEPRNRVEFRRSRTWEKTGFLLVCLLAWPLLMLGGEW